MSKVEFKTQVQLNQSHSPQALAWGSHAGAAAVEPFQRFIVVVQHALGLGNKPLKRFYDLLAIHPKLKLGVNETVSYRLAVALPN